MTNTTISFKGQADLMRQLKERSMEVSANFSDNYRQKLIYKLLTVLKSGNRNEFMWTLIKSINAHSEKAETKDLAISLNTDILTSKEFDKYAYSIILGVMSQRGKK